MLPQLAMRGNETTVCLDPSHARILVAQQQQGAQQTVTSYQCDDDRVAMSWLKAGVDDNAFL
jgi:hypothetical protein